MNAITRLAIGDQHTRVAVEGGPAPAIDLNLGIGVSQLTSSPARHAPPSEQELESAIAVVEDAVMPLAKVLPPATKLVSSDAIASRLLSLVQPAKAQGPGVLALEEVEHVFGELAAVSLGRPAASSGVPTDAAFVFYVLILREFMHHLAFTEISVEPPPSAVM
jgi:hypothetical protein